MYYGVGMTTIGPIVNEIFNNSIAWRPFLKMATTAHIGTFTVASISEMSCIGMIIMCAKLHRFTTICTIFMLSAGLIHFVSLKVCLGLYCVSVPVIVGL